MNVTPPYRFTNTRKGWFARPKSPDGIIIINIHNMFENGRVMSPAIRNGDPTSYCFGVWQDYFFKTVKKEPLPFHFFMEYLGGDWIITVGCNLSVRSWFIDEMIDQEFIDHGLRNHLVVAISHNTDLYPYPDRAMELISERVISHYSKNFGFSYVTSVKFFDEVLRIDWEEHLVAVGSRYKLKPERYTDYAGNRIAMRRYSK
jgi:hypothetical protein